MIGTVDAIILGDLVTLCSPCRRSLHRAWAHLRQQSQIVRSISLNSRRRASFTPTPAGVGHHPTAVAWSSTGNADARIECERGAAATVRRAEEIQRRRVRDGGGSHSRLHPMPLTFTLSRPVILLPYTHAHQDPGRPVRSVEIFASSWNMGGVDRESCLSPAAATGEGDLETGAGRSALQVVIPLWIPRGYDLYVSPPASHPFSQSESPYGTIHPSLPCPPPFSFITTRMTGCR